MRYLFTLLIPMFLLLNVSNVKAQTFTVINDTIQITAATGIQDYYDSVVTGTSPVTYSWKIIACNFPSDWLESGSTGFCDDAACRSLFDLWPAAISPDTTESYIAHDTSVLKLAMDLPSTATPGCYYVSAKLHNISAYSDSTTETWYICYDAPAATKVVTYNDNISVYPNPAKDELHVNYDANMNMANAEVYNLLGQNLKSVPCVNGSATIMLGDMPAGIYVVRLVDNSGSVNHIAKFTKE